MSDQTLVNNMDSAAHVAKSVTHIHDWYEKDNKLYFPVGNRTPFPLPATSAAVPFLPTAELQTFECQCASCRQTAFHEQKIVATWRKNHYCHITEGFQSISDCVMTDAIQSRVTHPSGFQTHMVAVRVCRAHIR